MIYTLTLNPAVDYKIVVDRFREGCLNRSLMSDFFAGGKGINVSSVLKSFGTESIAFGFVGGFTGNYIEHSLDLLGIKHDFVRIREHTRVNIKMMSNKEETEINGNSPVVLKNDLDLLISKLKQLDDGVLIMSGSIPSSLGDRAYNEIGKHISDKVRLIVDTSGMALHEAVGLKPFLIKPNIKELEGLLGVKLSSVEDIIRAGNKLIDEGVGNIIVSMGGEGAVFVGAQDVYSAIVPRVDSPSTIGAGDSVVAGFVHAHCNGKSFYDSFKFGVATGTATATRGRLCNLDDVKDALSKIKIKQIFPGNTPTTQNNNPRKEESE
ncbi:1-phosphofructokinase [Borrelia sp. P9F1]|uniref:1-phosphofructokinase n=1 Tax=Borrelia sp. P9F1 TaxID=3058374 RepID=UPI0026470484|nr:1-phosphofructokinase [Borrelia sp. P9F1]WKC58174.1 1-phosphofructokinase [Borrelia sp. P9F1]